MKNYLFLGLLFLFLSCSSGGSVDRTMYTVNFTVTATSGTTLNKIEYRDGTGTLKELTNVSSPWTISLQIRAGLGLEAAAYGDVPHQESLTITAVWTPEGGTSQSESQTLPNDTPNSIINNGRVEISGRTLPD